MIDILYKRSLVDKVFVSPVSSVKQQFEKRDQDSSSSEIMAKLNNAHGTTVDFLEFLKKNNKICVAVSDFAGLTASMMDLKR